MKACTDCFHFLVCNNTHEGPSHCRHFCKKDDQKYIISDKLYFCPGNCINDYETGYIDAIRKTNSPIMYAYWLVETDIDNTGLDMTIDQMWSCSNCKTPYHSKLRWYNGKRYTCGKNFCPECGATMLGFKVYEEKKGE